MMQTTKQRELLIEVQEHINAIPKFEKHALDTQSGESWRQGVWFKKITDDHGNECGTAACVCGWACLLHSGEKDYTNALERSDNDEMKNKGRELLGLNHEEADNLFEGENTLQRVNELINKILSKG